MIDIIIKEKLNKSIKDFYKKDNLAVQIQKTKKEFEGDVTIVVFPFLNISKSGPEETASILGDYLQQENKEIHSFNVVQGFLNLTINDSFWIDRFITVSETNNYGVIDSSLDDSIYLVEYSSPNTNKPLHLGHIRNNILGYSVSEILKAAGKKVKRVQIINDRGIHICKSMIAWQQFGDGEDPDSANMKGDHLVGKYYVEFDKQHRKELENLCKKGVPKDIAEIQTPIFMKAQEMLRLWEAKDHEIILLWKKLNSWVYQGFQETYDRLGIDFDKNYYESKTYLLGKEVVQLGLEKGIFFKKEDGSVWIDLSEEGLDEKIILRADGTSVYITQDIGTAIQRHSDFHFSNMVYTVGNEQEYHFQVLFLILKKLGFTWAESCYHLSYGMVNLPTGKMKSREGTVVDADDLMDVMVETARSVANELGKTDSLSEKDSNSLYEMVGIGSLKYFILKVDPRKSILFNPEESIDFNGNTAPFIQYTYARIQSLLDKNDIKIERFKIEDLNHYERSLIKDILDFPFVIQDSANTYNPSLIANYCFLLVKRYNTFYQNISILNASTSDLKKFRISLSSMVARIIKKSMRLLGIKVPDRM